MDEEPRPFVLPPPGSSTSEPAPATPPPEPIPAEPVEPRFTAEDWIGLVAAPLALVASLLAPLRADQPWADPTTDLPARAVMAVAAAAALGSILALPGKERERFRRLAGAAAGGLLFLAAAWVSVVAYGAHQALQPKMGALGHAGYVGLGAYAALACGVALAWSGIPTRRGPPPQAAQAAPPELGLPRGLRIGFPIALFVLAFAFYASDVEKPSIVDFDEAHYVRVALNLTDGNLMDPQWGMEHQRPHNFEHPPVGKYLIALSYFLHGEPHDELAWNQYHDRCKADLPHCAFDARSWRMGSVLVGSLGALGMYWLGLRLFRSVAVGTAAAGLLLMDNLYYLHARLAMLDIYPIGFVLLAFGVFLGPRRYHPWVGSVLFGLAVASKLSAIFLWPPFLVVAVLTSRHADHWMRIRDGLIRGIIVPAATYIVSYAPYWAVWISQHGVWGAVDDFVYVHQEGFRWLYRADVAPHPYVSPDLVLGPVVAGGFTLIPQLTLAASLTWITMKRPVLYFVGYDSQGNVGHIYAWGNPLIWWSGLVAVVYSLLIAVPRFRELRPRMGIVAFWQWLGRPFTFRPFSMHLLAALLFVSAFVPFLAVQRDQFNFYFLAAAPLLSLTLGAAVGRAWERGDWMRLVAVVALAACAAGFVFYHPIVAGTYIAERDFQFIMRRIPGVSQ